MWRRHLVLAALVAASVLTLPASSTQGASPRVREVRIENIDFAPHRLAVRRGDRVRWVWLDAPTQHNVTSRGRRRFRSSSTRARGTYTVRFRRAGTYRYICTIHFNMAATVVVR